MDESAKQNKKRENDDENLGGVKGFFQEVGEYLDEVARGETLTAKEDEFGEIRMLLRTDDEEKRSKS